MTIIRLDLQMQVDGVNGHRYVDVDTHTLGSGLHTPKLRLFNLVTIQYGIVSQNLANVHVPGPQLLYVTRKTRQHDAIWHTQYRMQPRRAKQDGDHWSTPAGGPSGDSRSRNGYMGTR